MRDQEIIGLYEAYASIYKNNNANEEFETWVNSLVEEGYDLSEYTWDDMYEMYVNLDENMTPADIERIAQQAAGKKKKQKKLSGFREESQMTPADIERIAQQAAGKKKKQKKLSGFKEESEYDVYDLILSHLLDEGYADTEEAAEAIMSSMSEEWREEILDEAKVDTGLSDDEKRVARVNRRTDDSPSLSVDDKEKGRQSVHKFQRGMKKPEAKSRPTGPGKYGAMKRRKGL